jgi:hypothetical protein
MWGIHAATGGNDLTNVTVEKAYVKIPGLPAMSMAYGNHPTKPPVAYWTYAWKVPPSYPLGIVNFTVTVVTNPVPAGLTAAIPSETGVFSQKALATPSQLTIVPS